MTTNSIPSGTPVDPEEEYLGTIQREITQKAKYFQENLRKYRRCRIVTIFAAALVPVLASINGVPRSILALVGSISLVSASWQELHQYQQSSLSAMVGGNRLERLLLRYQTGVPPFDKEDSFVKFAEQIEATREETELAFSGLWQKQFKLHSEK